MSHDVIPAAEVPRIPVVGGGSFPVHRIYCVGRNFADHAREMGASAPASKAERGQPTFFMKPADAIVVGHGDQIPLPARHQANCIMKWNWWWRWAAMRLPASCRWNRPSA